MNRSHLEALALFAVALAVRIPFSEASYFGPDQVGILLEGRAVLQGHLFPPVPGVGWTPFKLGPLFEWVTAIGLLPRDRFSDVLLLVGVMHAAAVVGWSRLFATIGGPARHREARIAGWALALNPLSISSLSVGGTFHCFAVAPPAGASCFFPFPLAPFGACSVSAAVAAVTAL